MPAPPTYSAAYTKALPGYEQTIATDIANNNFSDAWQFATSHGDPNAGQGAGGVYAAQYDPLTALLETGSGVKELDPTKQWTQEEEQQFYTAAGSAWGGLSKLGQNPESALWGAGDQNHLTGDANTDFQTNQGAAPDLARFAGTKQTSSFLDKYGADIATLALAFVAPEAIGSLEPFMASGTASVLGAAGVSSDVADVAAGLAAPGLAGAAYGAGSGALIAGMTGQNIGQGALKGGLSGGLGAVGAQVGNSLLPGLGGQLGSRVGKTIGQGIFGSPAAGSPGGPSPQTGGSGMSSTGNGNMANTTLQQAAGGAASYLASQGANTVSNNLQNAYTTAGNNANLRGGQFTGQGGFNVTANPNGQGGSFNYGAYNSPYTAAGAGAGASYGMANNFANGTLPMGYMSGLNGVGNATSAPIAGTQGMMTPYSAGFGQVAQGALGQGAAGLGMMNNPYNTTLTGYATQAGANATTGFNQVYNQALNAQLAALQRPEQLTMANTADAEFGRGQTGSTAGGLQTEAMAQGFGNAALQAQINATGQAQQYQTQQAGLAGQFNSMANQNQLTGSNIASSGFANYGNASSGNSNIANSIFNQNSAINQLGVNNATTNFNAQGQAGMYGANAATAWANAGNNMINGGMNIQNGGYQGYDALLRGNSAQAQVGIGASNAQTGAATGAARYGAAPNSGWASMLNGVSGSSGNTSNIGGLINSGYNWLTGGNSAGSGTSNGNVLTGFAGNQDPGAYSGMDNTGIDDTAIANTDFSSWSDRRLKKNIQRVGTLTSGIPVYDFEYLWGERKRGVMADEVRKVFPNAVSRDFSGYDKVDYAKVA
jgi:hypothetical protein